MRFLPATLAFIFALTAALRATDFPTVKAALPEINTTQGSAIASIDLRNYFEVTSIQGQVVQFRTNLGTFNLELFPTAAPASVANFLNYVNGGRYVNTFVHRSDQNLGIIQGGGYGVVVADPLDVDGIATDPPIALEYNLPNARGTIAMARTAVQNSATSQWFINTKDNTDVLGQSNGGGYAVFGRVTGTGMTVVDAIQNLTVYQFQSPFGQLPLVGYGSGLVVLANLVLVNGAESVPIFPAAAGQNSVVSFSVTSNSNPSLLSAAVNGSSLNLTLTVGQFGFADLTVTATDSNGNTTQNSFRVNVSDAPGEIAVEQPLGTALSNNGSRAYPIVNEGSTADLVFTIRSIGPGGLLLTGTPKVAIDGPDAGMFSVISQPAAALVSQDGSTTFAIRCAPTSGGTKTAALHIANTDSDENPFDINLTGPVNARPALTLPASPVTETATSPNGAVVFFTVTASDNEDGALTPTVVPPSGSTFPVGDTTVQVSATDSHGAQTSDSFIVRVLPPPPEMVVEQPAGDDLADGGNRAFALVNVGNAADLGFTIKNTGGSNLTLGGNPKVTVDGADAVDFTVITQPTSPLPASGSTTFTVRFTPTSGGQKSAALHITNDDPDENPFDINLTGTGNARPTLTLPTSPVIAEPTSAFGTVVNYQVAANDTEDGPLTPTVTPPSGSAFPVGDWTVNVSATDSNGAVTTGSFTVRVGFQRPAVTTATISAQTGEAAPGAGTDSLPANAELQSFGPPAVNDFRALAARVNLSAGSTTLPGIYIKDTAGPARMAAYKGGAVPGIASTGTTFKRFSEPVMSENGSIAFIGTLKGGDVNTTEDAGVWTDAFGGGLQLVLREGSQVPGLPTGATLKSVSSISLRNDELLVLLTLNLARGVVTDGNDTVLLNVRGPNFASVLLREGKPLNGLIGSKIKSFSVLSPAQGSPGHGRWHAAGSVSFFEGPPMTPIYTGTVIAKVTLADGRTLLVKLPAGSDATPLLSTTDPATAVNPLARWKTFGLPAIASNGAGFTVAATLKLDIGGVLEKNNEALLFSSDGSTWSAFARENDPAPVTPAGARYDSFLDPVINDAGNIAFLATLRGRGVDDRNDMALFSGPANEPVLIARLGGAVPDEDGATTAAVWSKFVSSALPSGPGAAPIFLAKTRGGDTNANNNLGLWAVDSQGTLRRLLRTGTALSDGGPLFTGFKLLNAASGAYGVTRSFNTSGSVALVATFADATQALLRVDIP